MLCSGLHLLGVAGNYSFSDVYNACVPLTFRVVNDRDVVTSIPKFLFLFKHVGQEVIIDRNGNYIFNPSFVERSMRDNRNSVQDHGLVRRSVYS